MIQGELKFIVPTIKQMVKSRRRKKLRCKPFIRVILKIDRSKHEEAVR